MLGTRRIFSVVQTPLEKVETEDHHQGSIGNAKSGTISVDGSYSNGTDGGGSNGTAGIS